MYRGAWRPRGREVQGRAAVALELLADRGFGVLGGLGVLRFRVWGLGFGG